MDRWVLIKDSSDDNIFDGCAFICFVIVFGALLSVVPGVISTALINNVIPITTIGALWITDVVSGLIILGILWLIEKDIEEAFGLYVFLSLLCVIFIVVFSFINSNNMFLSTFKRMICFYDWWHYFDI